MANPVIPGSFPEEQPVDDAEQSLDFQILDNFQRSEFIATKSRNQRDLLINLEASIYAISGYIFIKYCHSACILPFVMTVSLQTALSVSAIANSANLDPANNEHVLLNACVQHIAENENQRRGNPNARQKILSIFNGAIFVVFLLLALYHVLFVAWLYELAEGGHLQDIANGSWWFISFIGESVPLDYSEAVPLYRKLWQLGLYQLLFFDVVILLFQLIIFQSIWRQSTKGLLGHTLRDNEMEVVRPSLSTVLSSTLQTISPGNKEALRVRLYECFQRHNFGF